MIEVVGREHSHWMASSNIEDLLEEVKRRVEEESKSDPSMTQRSMVGNNQEKSQCKWSHYGDTAKMQRNKVLNLWRKKK